MSRERKPYGETLPSDNLSVSLGKSTGGLLKCYQAFVSVVGMGDDINGIIRTCPAPRDGESELACQAGPTWMSAFLFCFKNYKVVNVGVGLILVNPPFLFGPGN